MSSTSRSNGELNQLNRGVSWVSGLAGAALLVGGILAISLTGVRKFATGHPVVVAYGALAILVLLVWLLPRALEANVRLADRVRTLETEIAALRLPPTERDRAQFAEVLEYWSWGSELGIWLRGVFVGAVWPVAIYERIHTWTLQHSVAMYDNKDVDLAYRHLIGAINNLSVWMRHHVHEVSDGQAVFGINQQELAGPEDSGFKAAVKRQRDTGGKLHDEVAQARREFERVGRARGL